METITQIPGFSWGHYEFPREFTQVHPFPSPLCPPRLLPPPCRPALAIQRKCPRSSLSGERCSLPASSRPVPSLTLENHGLELMTSSTRRIHELSFYFNSLLFIVKDDIVIVTAGIIKKDNKILIAKRKEGHLSNKWEFLGVKLESGELLKIVSKENSTKSLE